MKVVVSTDGSMAADRVAPFLSALAAGDEVVVLTVVEIPRMLLSDMRRVFGAEETSTVSTDAEYVGEGAGDAPPVGWPGDDSIIDRYLDDQGEQRAGPLVAALRQAGIEVAVDVREGEDAAAGVLAALAEIKPDVVVASATGRGLFQGLLGSTSTKLMRHAPCPVLLIRD